MRVLKQGLIRKFGHFIKVYFSQIIPYTFRYVSFSFLEIIVYIFVIEPYMHAFSFNIADRFAYFRILANHVAANSHATPHLQCCLVRRLEIRFRTFKILIGSIYVNDCFCKIVTHYSAIRFISSAETLPRIFYNINKSQKCRFQLCDSRISFIHLVVKHFEHGQCGCSILLLPNLSLVFSSRNLSLRCEPSSSGSTYGCKGTNQRLISIEPKFKATNSPIFILLLQQIYDKGLFAKEIVPWRQRKGDQQTDKRNEEERDAQVHSQCFPASRDKAQLCSIVSTGTLMSWVPLAAATSVVGNAV